MRSALRKAIDGVRWYVRELTDESAYDRYVAHAGANHPHTPTPSRREFERMRTNRQEKDPRQGFRCC
ncbi:MULTISPECIES: YbdD/YjiX family protein [unclassified Streptomyces]|uniref:YbdD/YjiX family protein n=1 Tax=unclassified Streptomyces TaxID=2593676 RepID=UPI00224DCA7F|nr:MULTISPECIES: YbdD/YjiX family protein [unclassified Streptomyces]MCX4971526.1 YbdD/YjiX family protein [Streptomyces sp. NBC_00620]WUC13941.1 YbdD/YjiX family protein [Streptomyces sp. NBC_00564]WUC49550.1 YbdD/YjiX family protein [Streptomyces sp. NBC_00554]